MLLNFGRRKEEYSAWQQDKQEMYFMTAGQVQCERRPDVRLMSDLPLQVLRSGCRVKPTGQLQRTPVTESWHVLSQPPLFTAQVSARNQAVRWKYKVICCPDLIIQRACLYTVIKVKIRSHDIIYSVNIVNRGYNKNSKLIRRFKDEREKKENKFGADSNTAGEEYQKSK